MTIECKAPKLMTAEDVCAAFNVPIELVCYISTPSDASPWLEQAWRAAREELTGAKLGWIILDEMHDGLLQWARDTMAIEAREIIHTCVTLPAQRREQLQQFGARRTKGKRRKW